MYFLIILCNLLFNTGIMQCSVYNAKRVMEVPLSIVEYYKIDDYLYMFFSERVTWDEAQTICPNYDAQLAVVNTRFKANKLAAAMAESNIDMEDIWIGGQRSEKGLWEWINHKHLPSQSSNGFPPWVRYPNRPLKQCVALHRFAIDLPLFVDLDCRLSKPFICQRDSDAPGNPDVALPSHMATYDKSTYILYHSRVSWATAAAFCRIRGYRLAIIPNNVVAKIISTAMIRSRPSFENVWISGHFYHNKWTWLPTGDTMENYPNEHNYPPWHHNSTHQTSGCILLDRHVCDDPVFLALSCDHKRDFVCEKFTKGTIHYKKSKIKDITYKNTKMILILKELSWNEAQEYCRSEKGHLVEVDDYDMLKVITTAMSDQESEPVHAWLGGILVNDSWIWTNSKKAIPISQNKTGFMPWCDIEQKEDDNCLNIDREAHDKPVVYGLNCEVRQPFVCTVGNKRARSTRLNDYPPAMPLRHGSSSLIIFFLSSSYESSLHECTRAGGKLAELNPDDINNIADTLLKNNDDIPEVSDMSFWTKAQSKCSHLNVAKKRIEVTSDCLSKQGFICKPICSTPESLDVFNETVWKCKGKSRVECRAECKGNTILVGPDTVVCDDLGWVSHSNTTGFLPFCESNDGVTNDVIDLTEKAFRKYKGCLFVTDESNSVSREEWSVQLQFIASMIQVFPLSINWTMGLIMFSSTVQVPVPFEATDTCKVLEILSKLEPNEERDFTYMKEALEEADNQIKKFHKDQPTIIFIISDGENNGDDFNEIMDKLKMDHLIISIGINMQTMMDLNNLASTTDDQLLMYNFQKFIFFKEHTLTLMKRRSKNLNCPNNLYSVLYDTKKPKAKKVKKRQYLPVNSTCNDNPISIKFKDITYTSFFVPSRYREAKLYCLDEGGRLASVEENQLEIIVDSLVNTSDSCYGFKIVWGFSFPWETVSASISSLVDIEQSPSWRVDDWEKFKSTEGLSLGEFNVVDQELWIDRSGQRCGTLHIRTKQINSCTEHDNFTRNGFICENGCTDPPTANKYIYNNWNCNYQSKFKNCHVKCKGKAILAGTSTMICKPDGWVTLNNETTEFPVCLRNEEFEDIFLNQIRKLRETHEGFLFVFDKQKNDLNGTLKQLDFMKIILEIFPPSENFPVGLILLDGDAKVQIPYNETNFCLVRRKLHHLKHTATYKSKNNHNLYNVALMEVEKQISTLQSTRKTLIFLVSDRPNSGNNYTDILNKLKKEHTVFSIGGNYDGLKDLNIIASMYTEHLLMYTFKSYEHLDYTMKIMKKHHGKHYKCAGEES